MNSNLQKLLFKLLWYANVVEFFLKQDIKPADDSSTYEDDVGAAQLVQVQKKENIIEKSFDKLKEASTVWIFFGFSW